MLPDAHSQATRSHRESEQVNTSGRKKLKPAIASHWHTGRGSSSRTSVVLLNQRASFLAMLRVVGALPRRHRQAIARVSVSALVASLPLLYVSLLRPPPTALAGDTAFWFLMSNCVIAAIVATADDPGALFFGSSSSNDVGPCDDRDNDHVSRGRQPVAGGAVQEEVVPSTMAGSNPMDLVASPFIIEAESADAANKPGTDLPGHLHVQRGERHETAIEQSTDQNNTAVTMMVKGHEGEEIVASPTPAPDEAIVPVGKLAIVKALTTEPEAEPEPWAVPKLVTSKSLPDEEVQEEEDAADEEWPAALYSRPPDVLAHGKRGGRLRRSVTGGSKSVAEESEYWQLSDEELNRRVEDFIARFNRQMRLQIEQEAGA